MTSTGAAGKPVRADARRNYEALLAAGKAVFAQEGADAPMEDIGKLAGVGQGTLYRHFPSREHLFVAILNERVSHLEASAAEALDMDDTWAGLTRWLRLYDAIATGYRGMSALVVDALSDERSLVAEACTPMRSKFALLLARAQREGIVRGDVTAVQVLTLIGALPKPDGGATAEPYLEIVFAGLRAGAADEARPGM
jgi:AcrR family transcriptional regulator